MNGPCVVPESPPTQRTEPPVVNGPCVVPEDSPIDMNLMMDDEKEARKEGCAAGGRDVVREKGYDVTAASLSSLQSLLPLIISTSH